MWFVINFQKDNTVDVVPSSWYKNGLCAWPIKCSNTKKIVQKKLPPNKKEFKWHIARKLGSCYDTYEEAKYKAKIAQESSDLSGTENALKDRKIRAKMIDNSPSPEQKKKAIKSPPVIFLNKESVSESESNDDSDLDPDFTLHIDTSPIFLNGDNDNDNSPNEKSLSGTKMISDSKPLKPQKKFLSHTQPTNASRSKHLFDTSFEAETSPQLKCTIPIKRKLFVDGQESLKSNDFSKKSCFDQSTNKGMSDAELSLTLKTSITSNQGYFNKCKTGIEPTAMSVIEFQKYVVNMLSVMKYDISCCISTNQLMNANINTLLENINKNSITASDDGLHDFDLNDIFPIESHEALHEFELQLQKNENNFKTIMVRKLSLLVTNKSVGDSLRRVMSRMFDDKVLENYSTYGFKKKLRFSSLYSYRLLIDILRTHIKYKTVPEKDVDNDIGTWLAHARFRRVKKMNKTI